MCHIREGGFGTRCREGREMVQKSFWMPNRGDTNNVFYFCLRSTRSNRSVVRRAPVDWEWSSFNFVCPFCIYSLSVMIKFDKWFFIVRRKRDTRWLQISKYVCVATGKPAATPLRGVSIG